MDLLKSMKLHEVDKEEYEWYIKLKEKYPYKQQDLAWE